MWLPFLSFIASVVFVCKACSTNHTSLPFSDEYANLRKLADFLKRKPGANCGVHINALSTKVNSEYMCVLICTNSSYKEHDLGYYEDTVLDRYNISSNAKSLVTAFGSKSNSTFQKIQRLVVFRTIVTITECSELQENKIINSNIASLLILWIHQLSTTILPTTLNILDIRNTPINIPSLMYAIENYSFKELTMRNCSLYDLPDLYTYSDSTRKLVRLDLSHNHLRFLPFVSEFTKSVVFNKLEFMDLSYNELTYGASVMYSAAFMPRLRYMILDHNPQLDICNLDLFNDHQAKPKGQLSIKKLLDVRMVSASFTGTSSLCFGLMIIKNLEVLNISYSKVSTLSFQGLPALTASNFTMDLRGNNITDIQFSAKNKYDAMKLKFMERNNTKTTVLVNVKQLQCECQYSWLQKALKNILNLNVQSITCSNEIQLIRQKWDHLNCTKFHCGACHCRRDEKSTTANCTSRLNHTIPMVENLSHLHAASNHIKSLNASLFSDTLVWVDVSANRISRLDLKTIRAMFSIEDRHFKLAGNPIICDCTNQELLRTFRLHRHQVDDYEKLTCYGSMTFLNDVNENHLCDSVQSKSGLSTLTIALAAICVVVVVFALMTFMYYRYEHKIKTFLYVRGLLPRFIKENDIDENRPYDVFISFAHEDEEFVSQELLPGLEKGAIEYKTCVHLRDWIPGEMIPTQIIKSIEKSRRTLVVVSRSYVKSQWGLMEFHTAYTSAITESRIRVIVILLEDMYDNDLCDPELRFYMQTNTYLKWGDRWFWDKLRYALPYKPGM